MIEYDGGTEKERKRNLKGQKMETLHAINNLLTFLIKVFWVFTHIQRHSIYDALSPDIYVAILRKEKDF